MTRIELRLALLKIAHHPAQGTETTMQIVRELEAAFAADGIAPDDAPPKKEPKAAK